MIIEAVENMPTLAWFVTAYKFYQKYDLEVEYKMKSEQVYFSNAFICSMPIRLPSLNPTM